MFEQFRQGSAMKEERKNIRDERDFVREQSSVQLATSPDADRLFFEEQNKRSDLIIWQQDMETEKDAVIHILKKERKNPTTGMWAKVPGEVPLCNDLFIDEIVTPIFEPFLSKNMFNTNLSETTILKTILQPTYDDITGLMADGYDIYGIDFIKYDFVLRVLKTYIKAAVYRSLLGFTKKIDTSAIKRIEAYNENPALEKKKGMFGVAI